MRPRDCGIGLRAPHVAEVLEHRPVVGWLEVHAENYMGGGAAIRTLEPVRAEYPLSVHGVGLSICSAECIDTAHLERLARLVARLQPVLASEHGQSVDNLIIYVHWLMIALFVGWLASRLGWSPGAGRADHRDLGVFPVCLRRRRTWCSWCPVSRR